MPENWEIGGFGIYVHWPFCEAKCPYCDFNSHVTRVIDHDAWCTAYLEELDRAADLTPGHRVRSIFFGGGTPSLMRPDVVGAVIDRIQRLWPMSNDVEITLEANPSSVEAATFAAFRTAGVNRISMGIQALNDSDLRRLGRLHSRQEALDAFDVARREFDRVSFDLIYGRQDQSLAEWEAELREALSLAVDHLSLYQLTIEDGTAFGDRFAAGKLAGLPDHDLGADMYELTQRVCEDGGMPRYEVSNHAASGAESQHNLVYWRSGDWVGIGPGAHGRIGTGPSRLATEQTRAPMAWLHGKRDAASGVIDIQDQAAELLLMGLRLAEGVDIARYNALAGQELDQGRISGLVSEDLAAVSEGRLIVNNQGVMVLNHILRTLLGD